MQPKCSAPVLQKSTTFPIIIQVNPRQNAPYYVLNSFYYYTFIYLWVSPLKRPFTILYIRAIYPAHLLRFYVITLTVYQELYKSRSSPFYSFSNFIFTTFLWANIFCFPCSSRNITDRVSHPHKTRDKISLFFSLCTRNKAQNFSVGITYQRD